MDDLRAHLAERASRTRKHARKNYFAAYALFLIAITSSAAATISVSVGLAKELSAILAAMPGIMLLVNNTLKLEARSRWHWNKAHRLEQLLRELVHEGRDLKEVSRELTNVEKEMEGVWPGFGDFGGAPGTTK